VELDKTVYLLLLLASGLPANRPHHFAQRFVVAIGQCPIQTCSANIQTP